MTGFLCWQSWVMRIVVGGDKVQESKTLIGWVCHDDGKLMDLVRVDTIILGNSVIVSGTLTSTVRIAVNMNVRIENMDPVDIGLAGGNVVFDVVRIWIVMIIHGVGQVAERVEGGGSVEIIGDFVKTAGMSQGVTPVVDDAIKAGFIVADLIVVGTVRVC